MAGQSVEVEDEGGYPGFWTLLASGKWEPETLRALDVLVGPGTHYLDIGTWIGPTALYAAARGAVVHAFEPDPEALKGLDRHLEINPHLAKKVTVHRYALGAQAGTLPLTSTKLGNSESTLRRGRGESVHVDVRRFEDEVAKDFFRSAGVVKIDIEGGEYPLLPAIARMLERQHMILILSTHVSHIRATLPSRWPRIMRGIAYRATALADQCRLAVAPPPNTILVHRSGRWMDGRQQDGRGNYAGAPAQARQRRDDPLGASIVIVRRYMRQSVATILGWMTGGTTTVPRYVRGNPGPRVPDGLTPRIIRSPTMRFTITLNRLLRSTDETL